MPRSWHGRGTLGVSILLKRLLGVFEEPSAAKAYDDACERWTRASDALEAVKYVLVHDPEPPDSVVVDELGRVRALTWHGAKSADMPTIVVVYVWDTQNITILEARFSNAKAQQFGHA